jgi:hypothetical protein
MCLIINLCIVTTSLILVVYGFTAGPLPFLFSSLYHIIPAGGQVRTNLVFLEAIPPLLEEVEISSEEMVTFSIKNGHN